jgi:hypothetical protein
MYGSAKNANGKPFNEKYKNRNKNKKKSQEGLRKSIRNAKKA